MTGMIDSNQTHMNVQFANFNNNIKHKVHILMGSPNITDFEKTETILLEKLYKVGANTSNQMWRNLMRIWKNIVEGDFGQIVIKGVL